MDIFDYTHLDEDIRESLFEAMSDILINEFFSSDNLSTLVYCEFYEAGIDLKDYSIEYDKNEMLNFLNFEININNINIASLIESLFLYSCVDCMEYELLKNELVIDIENQASLMIHYKQERNIAKEYFIMYEDPTIDYTLELSLQQLMTYLNDAVNKTIKNEYEKLTNERLYVFREFSLLYDVEILYRNILEGSI